MRAAGSDSNGGSGSTEVVPAEPLECAQLVWRHAIALARSDQTRDRFVASLALLRTAQKCPSTLHHALTLGRTEQRAEPHDITTDFAVELLERTISWLGAPAEQHEVGATAIGLR